MDKRSNSKSEPSPHIYGAGTRLSSLYTMGRDGLPYPPHAGPRSSRAYAAWKRGRTDHRLIAKADLIAKAGEAA